MDTITTSDQIPYVIVEVFTRLTGRCRVEELQLGIGTLATESHLYKRVQDGGGPARGLCQMEPDTAYDIFNTYLSRPGKEGLFRRLIKIWLELDSIPFGWRPTREELSYHLEHYDDFAIAMMRIKYLRDPDPIPLGLRRQAAYYKRVYNTPAGAGSPEKFVSDWVRCKCLALVRLVID